jgi:hypothetical protein
MNQNLLGKNGFEFRVFKLPNTNFFVQRCNVPGLSIDPVLIGNPLVTLPYSGDHISYEELTISIKLDEDMGAYNDIHRWMRGLGFPENTDEYDTLAANSRQSGLGLFSDASLMILDAKKRPNYEITFMDAFPVSISSLQLGYDVTDVEYLSAEVSFRYTNFNITRVKFGSSEHIQNPGG